MNDSTIWVIFHQHLSFYFHPYLESVFNFCVLRCNLIVRINELELTSFFPSYWIACLLVSMFSNCWFFLWLGDAKHLAWLSWLYSRFSFILTDLSIAFPNGANTNQMSVSKPFWLRGPPFKSNCQKVPLVDPWTPENKFKGYNTLILGSYWTPRPSSQNLWTRWSMWILAILFPTIVSSVVSWPKLRTNTN